MDREQEDKPGWHSEGMSEAKRRVLLSTFFLVTVSRPGLQTLLAYLCIFFLPN